MENTEDIGSGKLFIHLWVLALDGTIFFMIINLNTSLNVSLILLPGFKLLCLMDSPLNKIEGTTEIYRMDVLL